MAKSHAWFQARAQIFHMLDNLPEDSRWYREAAEQMVAEIVRLIGVELYRAWCDRALPDGEFSFKFLYQRVSRLKLVLEYPQLAKEGELDGLQMGR